MTDIVITKINETWMKVQCSEVYMELDLSDAFSFEVPGAKFDHRVKSGKWDGIKKLYNRQTKKLYVGLLLSLLSLCDKKGWSYHLDPDLFPSPDQLEIEDLEQLIELINPHSNGNKIEPFDYQIDAVTHMLNMGRSTILASTSAGKSLILYLAIRIYQLLDDMRDKTIFVVVPSASLVEQLYNDFDDYSTFEGRQWSVGSYVQKISGKHSKFINKQVVIITWQSMCKLPYSIYDNLGVIFVDETHTASASTLVSILEQCVATKYRHGLTGTLDGAESNEMTIQGLLGHKKRIVTAKQIIDQGRAAEIEVNMTMLEYPYNVKKELAVKKANVESRARFQAEVEYVNSLEYRRQFIYEMVRSVKGNTLILFDRVDSYGKEMYEAFKSTHENTFLVVGDTDSLEREDIRQSMEQYDDAVIFASYQCFQQGISIKRLHNLFLVSSSKSLVRILQSIGRMMRLHETKDVARIYDVVDNMTYDDRPNYMMKHAQDRISIYSSEEFKINFNKFDMTHMINRDQNIDDFL